MLLLYSENEEGWQINIAVCRICVPWESSTLLKTISNQFHHIAAAQWVFCWTCCLFPCSLLLLHAHYKRESIKLVRTFSVCMLSLSPPLSFAGHIKIQLVKNWICTLTRIWSDSGHIWTINIFSTYSLQGYSWADHGVLLDLVIQSPPTWKCLSFTSKHFFYLLVWHGNNIYLYC